MMRLLRVELDRLRWRRAILVLLVASIAIPMVMLLGYAWSTRPLSAGDIAEAKATAAQEAEQPYITEEITRCQADPGYYGGPDMDPAECEAAITPTYENFLYRPTFDIESLRRDLGAAVIVLLSGLMMLIGTTFVGHDWNTGSMSNQLLFEPRRLRVWLAKATGVVAIGAVTAAGVLAMLWGGAALIASSREITAPPGFWRDMFETQGRGVLAIALAGLLGVALTMLFRSTVATLSVMFAVALAGSAVILAVLGESAMRWLLPSNFMAFVLGGLEYYDSSCPGAYIPEAPPDCARHISTLDGGLYLGVVLAVAVALSLWSMQRRDVP